MHGAKILMANEHRSRYVVGELLMTSSFSIGGPWKSQKSTTPRRHELDVQLVCSNAKL
jgi:hypothetical protein